MCDACDRASSLNRHAGVNIPNHQGPKTDGPLDRLRQAGTEADYIEAGEDLQEYSTSQMLYFGVATLPDIEAARDYVKGYVFMRGFKKRFETVWLNR
jgi:hypothetical protein